MADLQMIFNELSKLTGVGPLWAPFQFVEQRLCKTLAERC
jgi:hypothetical protein